MSEPKTETIEAQGAEITYDVRESDSPNDDPILMMIGSPMDASGFATLSEHFRDRTLVTYDPRGAGRSQRTDGAEQSTPDEHADDLHRVISAVGRGPVDLFASSGGAVNALALVAKHPEDVRILIAHEPPAAQVLPDREEALAAAVDIHETYEREGTGPAMAKFLALSSIKGPVPADFAEGPGPNPADFGLPTEDDGTRDDPLLGQNMVTGTQYEHDFDALARGADAHRRRGRRRVGGRADLSRGARRRGATGDGGGHLPEPPRRFPRRRVRVAGRPRRVRPQAARGASSRGDRGVAAQVAGRDGRKTSSPRTKSAHRGASGRKRWTIERNPPVGAQGAIP